LKFLIGASLGGQLEEWNIVKPNKNVTRRNNGFQTSTKSSAESQINHDSFLLHFSLLIISLVTMSPDSTFSPAVAGSFLHVID
jgi:hypothetical protein